MRDRRIFLAMVLACAGLCTAMLCTAMLGFSTVARATTYPGLDWARLIDLSEVVVRVRVDTVQTRRLERRSSGAGALASGASKLATFYEANVLEVLHGSLPARGRAADPVLVFALPGGTLGKIGQRVSGMPTIEVGQEYVLFLGPGLGPGGARGVVGHALGTLKVRNGKLFADRQYGAHREIPRRLTTLRQKLGQSPVPPVPVPTVPVPPSSTPEPALRSPPSPPLPQP